MKHLREFKPSVLEALPLVRAVYRKPDGAAGCCLHIVLDDYNTGDNMVESCIEGAEHRGHEDCAILARMLRSMSQTQRRKVAQMKGTP